MKIKLAIVTVFIAALAVSQEARIMIVEKDDSKTLSVAYKDYKDAQKRWEKVKTEVAKKYTVQDGKTIEGWDHVQFSADFRAIVPANSQYAGVIYNGGYWTPYGSILSSSSPVSSNSGTFSTGGTVTANDLRVSDDVLVDLKTKSK